MTSAYPLPHEELVERVRALAVELGEWPSQRRVMRTCRVGAPRADGALAALRSEGFDPSPRPDVADLPHLEPAAARTLTVVPDAPETQPERGQEHAENGAPGASEGAPGATVEAATGRPDLAVEPLVSGAAGAVTPERGRRDWITDLGVLVVGLAAAVLTFTTLRDLAQAVGIVGDVFGLRLAWLLPVTIDAAGIVAARVWLRGQGGAEAVAFARVLTLVCIALSVCGNAGQHLMASQHLAPEWWAVVLVTSVPPAALGAVVHLGHLIHRQES